MTVVDEIHIEMDSDGAFFVVERRRQVRVEPGLFFIMPGGGWLWIPEREWDIELSETDIKLVGKDPEHPIRMTYLRRAFQTIYQVAQTDGGWRGTFLST